MNVYNLKRICLEKEYISFDIFDTLVGRDVLIASDIFELTGEKILGVSFAKAFRFDRINAERIARAKSSTNEVCLESIYDNLCGYDEKTKNDLMEEEIRQEIANCFEITTRTKFFNEMVNDGKKCVLISDMYLPKHVIKAILDKCGINNIQESDIFISNECRCCKSSGKLFSFVLANLGIESESIIHFGDSIRADYIGARKANILSKLLVKKRLILRKIKSVLIRLELKIYNLKNKEYAIK